MKEDAGDIVRDMNLEASLEKNLLLHGVLRRDFTDEEIEQLRSELEALHEGGCSVLNGFWSTNREHEEHIEDPDSEPESLFSIGERVWVTENETVSGKVPGVGTVRKVEKEWVDLGDELKGYWEITYQLKNMRTPFTEGHVFATELEALAAMAASFRQQTIMRAKELCRRMRALGMNITTKELLDNIAQTVEG